MASGYYEQKFKNIEEGNGIVSWNWFAFVFIWAWYFSKGMWAKGLIILFLMSITFWLVFPLFILWIYCGIFGNYDYYLLESKSKQLW